jgi:outer membrane lipoprotein-sorting protein
MGFEYLHSVLRHYEITEKENFYNKIIIHHDSTQSKKNYYIMEIINEEFGFFTYKTLKRQTLTSSAKKFHVNDHMILELNSDIKYYDDVKPGQLITIPNSFAKRIVFYIDKKNYLPLTQYIYDHKGLFSKIEFSSFVLNPPIKPEEFTRKYPKYKF